LAVDFYVNRQEWLEKYYGRYGMLISDTASALGAAVMDAEARYHTLIILLSDDSPAPASVDSLITRLNEQYQRVLEEASRTRVLPVPRDTTERNTP
jgi:hypothetical protein